MRKLFLYLGIISLMMIVGAIIILWFSARDAILMAALVIVWTVTTICVLVIITLFVYLVHKLANLFSINRAESQLALARIKAEYDQLVLISPVQAQSEKAKLEIETTVMRERLTLELEAMRVDLVTQFSLATEAVNQARRGLTAVINPRETSLATLKPNKLNFITNGHNSTSVEDHPIPDRVDIESLVNPQTHSVRRLIIGAKAGGEIMTCDMRKLFHILEAGTTQWGKSIWLKCFTYQLLVAREKTQLYFSDIGENTFLDFGLPFASTVDETEDMLNGLWVEVARRKKLWAEAGVRSLDQYNQVTGEDLAYTFFLGDEMTHMFDRKSSHYSERVVSRVGEIGRLGAKYGVYLVVSGQDWKADIMPTSFRHLFASRFQFKTMDRSQADILIKGSGADQFEAPGRCSVYIAREGRPVLVQTPHIEDETIANLALTTPENSLARDDSMSPAHPMATAISEMYQAGASLNKCYKTMYEAKHHKALGYKPNRRNRKEIAGILQDADVSLRTEDVQILA